MTVGATGAAGGIVLLGPYVIVVGGLLLAGIGAYVGVNTYQCCKIFKEYQPIWKRQ